MIISYLALVMDADKAKFLEAWQADLVILGSHGAARWVWFKTLHFK